jgi:hypothetical protein
MENQSSVGRWSSDGTRLHIDFSDRSRGAVRLRRRDKDTFVGTQSIDGEQVAWVLSRVDTRLVGKWVVQYEQGGTRTFIRTYEFKKDGTVLFVDESKNVTLARRGDAYLMDFSDGRLDRLKLIGPNLFVEHYYSKTSFESGQRPDSVGRGVRTK